MIKDAKTFSFYKLICEATDFKKTAFFAESLKVSTKTIYNYLSELQYQYKDYNLQLIRKQGVGIYIEGSINEKKRFIRDMSKGKNQLSLSDERREAINERLLMNNEMVSVRKLSEEYDVSKSSIVNDLEQLEKQFKKQELVLIKNNNGTILSGKEQRLRSAKRYFIYEKLKKSVSIKEFISIQECERLLSKYIKKEYLIIASEMISYIKDKLFFEIEETYYLQIYIQFTIFIDRISQGYRLISTPHRPVVSELHKLKTYPIAEELCKKLEKQLNVEIRNLDIRWVNARIAGVYHEYQNTSENKNSKELRSMVIEMVSSVEDIFKTDLKQDKILINGLEKHFVPMISRMTNNIKVSNPFIEQIKQQYTAMFSVIWLAASIIEKQIGFPLSEDEISFILIHFQASMERRNLSKKIAIVSSDGISTAQLIESRVKNHLPTFDVIETFYQSDLKEKYFDEFDFIISTVPLNHIDKLVVVISPIASNEDISKINDFYYENFIKVNNQKLSTIIKAIDSDMILLRKKFRDAQEVLELGAKILMDKEYVSEGFLESMIQREKISPTELGHGIAIPHGQDQYVNTTKIMIFTLDEAIQWGKNKVNIIILLAVNFNDKQFSKKIFNDLYHMINSEQFIKSLGECNHVDEVKQLFNRT